MKKNSIKILFTAFIGKTNTAKILLDNIDSDNKLYLKNSYKNSVIALENELKLHDYDLVIAFGQLSLEKDTIQIERIGQGEGKSLETTFDYNELTKELERKYKVVISNDAGEWFCNNLYYHGLQFLEKNNSKTKMVFIHIPKIKNISNISELAMIINNYFKFEKVK